MPKFPKYIDFLTEIGSFTRASCSNDQNQEYKLSLENKVPLPDNIYLDSEDDTSKYFSVIQPKGYTGAEINSML